MQAVDLLEAKNRQVVVKHIKERTLNAIVVQGSTPAGRRYAIKGEWIISFNERKKRGLIVGNKYTAKELKNILRGAVEYCEKRNIKTVKEMTKSINKIK